jgi:hypothetical protein
MTKLRSMVENEYIYLILDETPDCRNRMVFNIMVGILSDSPKSPHLCSTSFLKKSCCSATVTQTLITGLQSLYPNGINYSNILLIITDAASYMVKAMTEFTSTIATNAIYLTCLAHGIQRVAECVRETYEEADKFVSNMKKILVKAPTRRVLFVESTGLQLPPEPIIVRWGTWISSVSYYAEHFSAVKNFVENLSNDSKAIENCKQQLQSASLVGTLSLIHQNFGMLPSVIEKLQSDTASLSDQISHIEPFQSKLPRGSSAAIKMENVLKKNSGFDRLRKISAVLDGSSTDLSGCPQLSPVEVLKFKFAPISSSSVERSFSQYRDLLTIRRESFTEESLIKHLFVKVNYQL